MTYGDIQYKTLGETWNVREEYAPRVTIPLSQWRQYVASGRNTLEGVGGVIPGGTLQTGFGQSGAVYSGHVVQSGWT